MAEARKFDESRVVGLILARGGSRGIPRKNLRALAGVPLVSRAVETLILSPDVSRVVVSTEDPAVASLALAYGGEIPFLRPAHLAEDQTPSLPVIEHAARALVEEGETAAVVICLQTTSPCCTAAHVGEALALFRSSGAHSLRSVTPVAEHPHWMGRIEDGRLHFLHPPGERATRRQDLPALYRLNGAITILKTERILSGNAEDEDPVAYVMDERSSIDLDTTEDWERAETILT